MKHPIFFLYDKKNNFLDELIKPFIKRRLICNREGDYFHEYYWPDITLSNRASNHTPKNGNEFEIELLGEYNPSNETVTLFIPKIKATSKEFLKTKTSIIETDSLNKITEDLSYLILIHEFTHWLIDQLIKIAKLNFEYSLADNVDFHESLAQLFTHFYCKKDSSLWELFQWLEERQPRQYTIYNELSNPKITDPSMLNVDQTIINKVLFATVLLLNSELKYPKQSFENIKDIYNRLEGSEQEIGNWFESRSILSIAICFNRWDWKNETFEQVKYIKRGCINGGIYEL